MNWERHLREVDNDEATGETLAAIDHALIELARLRRIEQAARAVVAAWNEQRPPGHGQQLHALARILEEES